MRNFNLDVLCLIDSVAGAGSDAGLSNGSGAGLGVGSRSGVGVLSFIGNIKLLKLLRTFFCCFKE